MDFRINSELDMLFVKLQNMKRMRIAGQRWAENSARDMYDTLQDTLEKQGRGAAPLLSEVTHQIYQHEGEPDGSGIRDHIQKVSHHTKNQSISTVGIPDGKPSMIAKVQDRGATIRVTSRMRGWLAYRGIYLNPKTKVIRTPARRFWRKSWSQVRSRSRAKLKQIMRGSL